MNESIENNWMDICHIDDISVNTGRCALHKGEQIAIFRVNGESLYALANQDPFSNANVISRGIVGCVGERMVVASPIYKQHFCLDTGECLEDDTAQLKTYSVRLNNDLVQLCS